MSTISLASATLLLADPSIDPVVFFKLQLVMFFEDIRSERLLMRQVADRLSVRWYVGYDLDEPLPDHSSLTRIRQRFGLPVFFIVLPLFCARISPVQGNAWCTQAHVFSHNLSKDFMRLYESALSLGYSRNEADWFFNELKAIEYQPVNLVCASGFEDFMALLSSISLGEAGLLLAGFARFTGDPSNDERLEKLIRVSAKG